MKQSLFRSIRRKLLDEGKLVRYLTYAVGEVVLIIVGIMIALQLNNWNEDRKAQVEFDEYIVQLREDVRTALSNTTRSIDNLDRQIPRLENIGVFLAQENYTQEELEEFERALAFLTIVSLPRVRIGQLGQLLEGDMRVISRDKNLGKRALEFENNIELVFNVFDQNVDRLNALSVRLVDHMGKGQLSDNVRPDYKLESLRSSQGFSYLVKSMTSDFRTNRNWYGRLKEPLEDFLTVLEEYE
jgi:hypothetical protein